MIEQILSLLKILLVVLPFLILVFLSNKANLKQEDRSRQCFMPVLAMIFCIIAGLLLGKINAWVAKLLTSFSGGLESVSKWVASLFDGALADVSTAILELSKSVDAFIKSLDVPFWAAILANVAIIIVYLILKTPIIRVLKAICKDDRVFYEVPAKIVYYKDEEKNQWFVKDHFSQGVTLMKTMYIASVVFAIIGIWVTAFMYNNGLIASLYYPVFSVILVGEVYFFMNGNRKQAESSSVEGEDEESDKVCDYSLMRNVLRRNFGDKLMAENTTVNNGLLYFKTNDELLSDLEDDETIAIEAYGRFMRYKASCGLEIDQNYLMSGLDLLKGKSIVFNNPFYYDLIPYIFYPMNRAILRHKKVLIVLGRHAMENDVETWCRAGLSSVTHIPSLWNIGVLGREEQNLDVGIVTRSSVHDLGMHEANDAFFAEVEFVVLIEPSRLVATAQIGLNSLVQHCRRDGKRLVFCSTDKNCDGIVDALSHILMTSLEEVSATNKHGGTSSYMCWEVDEDHLQHRMLPNLSRYLGTGTELSFTALKNQVSKTSWYGGEAFPVLDMHWIVRQYYYDLLHYASLPTLQSMIDDVFIASPNMWNANVEDHNYLTVEDESFNMFEVKREFSTRAKKQGFVNVISTDYLLKDYMAENDGIFDADSKAIPYIVADYARTERNVVYRLCLRLSAYPVLEDDIMRELSLIETKIEDVVTTLWHNVCKCSQSVGVSHFDHDGRELLKIHKNGCDYEFDASVINMKRKYSFKTGKMENMYSISDAVFIDLFLGDLCSAEYIAEDEKGDCQYLGTELRGHVFQKYLPGQFFTFGGKYYEMQKLSTDGKVLVRRAADHINGRPQYRQVRNYTINNAVDSETMGDSRDIGGIKITKQYADIAVETPAYWRMKRYNDFETGKLITINGVPRREYHSKQILKIDFTEGLAVTPVIRDTIALLMNEVFRTLYAENQGMIVAVTAGEAAAPLTYSLYGDGDFTPSDSSIYIIEDSQLDIGFLVSVERNLQRIFAIICDYLEWNRETLEQSMNPPPEPEKPDYTVADGEGGTPEKKKGIRGIIAAIAGFFKRIIAAIVNFFKKLFKRKPKAPKEPEVPETEQNVPVETEETGETGDTGDTTATEVGEQSDAEETSAEEAISEDSDVSEEDSSAVEEGEEPVTEEAIEEVTEATAAEITEEAAEEVVDETAEEPAEDEPSDSAHPTLFSRAPMRFYSEGIVEEIPGDATEEPTEEPVEEPAEEPAEVSGEEPTEAAAGDGTTLEFEPANETLVKPTTEFKRKPYHERYYLLYGGKETPETIDVSGTLDFLKQLGYGNNSLEQARKGKNEAENIEKNFVPNRAGSHYCDFCGVELLGMEYEVLSDGRERCTSCGKTAVKTEAEFKQIYEDVTRNMKVFYGVDIRVPVQIKMVNAKKLHRRLGKSFVPTGKADGRVLGVAIKDKNGYSIYLENGSPRLSATMTMVHEMTHIWQYLNWDAAKILSLYGKEQNLEIYEGMAKWSEIQYAYLINEGATAKREEIITRMRDDEYGHGFNKYVACYPLSIGTSLKGATPFGNPAKPL